MYEGRKLFGSSRLVALRSFATTHEAGSHCLMKKPENRPVLCSSSSKIEDSNSWRAVLNCSVIIFGGSLKDFPCFHTGQDQSTDDGKGNAPAGPSGLEHSGFQTSILKESDPAYLLKLLVACVIGARLAKESTSGQC